MEQYALEIYVGDEHAPVFADNSSTPFQPFAVGDFIHPEWRMNEPGYYFGDRLRVDRVEQIVMFGNRRKLMIFCEEVPGPQNPTYRG